MAASRRLGSRCMLSGKQERGNMAKLSGDAATPPQHLLGDLEQAVRGIVINRTRGTRAVFNAEIAERSGKMIAAVRQLQVAEIEELKRQLKLLKQLERRLNSQMRHHERILAELVDA
jgi:hypothetical protein